jgi:poly-beta-hydroxybutyrate-responsive repressor
VRRWRHRGGRRGRIDGAGGAIQRFLEPCLLLALHKEPSYGYELLNSLGQYGLGHIAPGPVYRMLREMEAGNLIKSEWDTDSTAGPARRVYQLTDVGHRYLSEWVEYLRATEQSLRHFLDAYDEHMKTGKGEHH